MKTSSLRRCFFIDPSTSAGISFTPKEVGEHVVSVKKSGKHVTNSPFKIMVGQSEIGDASKVKVFGEGLMEGHTFEMAEFIVDTRNAGTVMETSGSMETQRDTGRAGTLTETLRVYLELTAREFTKHVPCF